jgi:hypothetical protein
MSQHTHIGNQYSPSFTSDEINFIIQIYRSELPKHASPETAAVTVRGALLVEFNKDANVEDILVSVCFFPYYLC